MKRMGLDRLTAALNWCVDQGLITKNPIRVRKLGLRRRASRGREYVLQLGDHEKARAAAKPWFRELLDFLEGTGCRPGEAYHVEAKHYDPEQQLIRFRSDAEPPEYVHKTARKTGKDRVILLTPATAAIVERLAKKYPNGRLFRNRDRRPWTNSAVHLYLKRLTKKLGLSSHFVAYSYRHTFATRWLLAGGSIKVLAELLGNSVAMLERHYSHLEVDPASLRRLLDQFRQGATSGARQQPDVTPPP
jgi:integrase